MGVTTQAIFGATLEAQPAAPDTYGHRPSGFRLPEATHLGKVRLQVSDLKRSLAFYREILGLRIVNRGVGQATLAAHGDERIISSARLFTCMIRMVSESRCMRIDRARPGTASVNS